MSWMEEEDRRDERRKRRILAAVKRRETFYHFGPSGLKPGTVLRADPMTSEVAAAIEGVFEKVRREEFPQEVSRINAVFMTTKPGVSLFGTEGTWYEVRRVRGKVTGVINGIEAWTYAVDNFLPLNKRIGTRQEVLRNLRRALKDPVALRRLESSARYYWSGGDDPSLVSLGIEVIGQGRFEIVGPAKRKNPNGGGPDERLRRLEMDAASGDPGAEVAYHQELWRTGKAIPLYASLLLDDFVDDLRAFRSYTRLSHELAEPVLEGLEGEPASVSPAPGEPTIVTTRLIASPGGAEPHGAQVAVPDRFGRLRGYMLSMRVTPSRMTWTPASRWGFHRDERPSPSTVVEACVALTHPGDPFNSPIHPLYFFHRNDRRWGHEFTVGSLHWPPPRRQERIDEWLDLRLKRRLPVRMECSRILAADLDTYDNALRAIERALGRAFEDLNVRLGFVDEILGRAAQAVDQPITPEKIAAHVRSDHVPQYLARAADELHTAPGPVVGEGSPGREAPLRAWNMGGDGVLEAAMLSLAEWLRRNYRAVIQEVRADPYEQEGGWFVRGRMSVTTRRARRTRNPLRFEVDFDRVNGLWSDRNWIGNEIPPGGRWRIDMTRCPTTVQELVRPAESWIRSVFPQAQILVAAWHEGYNRPVYRESV